ncbi:DNA phosphorothioation-dependent restriction protein DptG [Paenibacillus cellulositrophicus]|uniref:DNA phosphorothioation-dependent restriction protein DptG n=1 Tax=Paenibacillus cellulositrophicus TaxID=562959 RepID=UPI00203F570C|nr:DNA phosphorothioation-dependent restriction protein DptG [Paenibacillus cellulositrophicus]MCM3001273.1 DNA phosphorothioation-dependent restriction protein DptG [Paenibacillus cellulositrophicus]
MPILKTEELTKNLTNKKVPSHSEGAINKVLPFATTKKYVKGSFQPLLGDYVRNITQIKIKKQKTSSLDALGVDSLIYSIEKSINPEGQLQHELENFLQYYLYGEKEDIKLIHPYIYNYLQGSDSDNLFRKVAKCASDVLVNNDQRIANIFKDTETEDVLSELIIGALNCSTGDHPAEKGYQCKLEFLNKLYCEDLIYISRHHEYFIKSLSTLTHFYFFNYICQLMLKFEQFDKGDYITSTPLYYALDWEGVISKRRKAASDVDGFKRIKQRSPLLFPHIHTMSQLSTFHGNTNNSFYTYSELVEYFSDPEKEKEYLGDVNDWIKQYRGIFGERVTPKEEAGDLKTAFRLLFESIKEGMNEGARIGYGNSIEHFGSEFLRTRGSSGTILMLNHEMLLLLTAVSVKDKRIPINQLFSEYEKRGVALDRHSKKVVLETLDNLNFIDKKSDSGDAQYVKPIL